MPSNSLHGAPVNGSFKPKKDRSRWRHPADKALTVTHASTERNTTETSLVFDTPRQMQNQDPEAHVFRRLVNCCRLLPDPVADLIYPKQTKHKSNATSKKSEHEVVHMVSHCPIELPTCCSFHQNQVKCVIVQQKKFLYNSPEPANVHFPSVQDRLERLTAGTAARNNRLQLPLSAVDIRWHEPYAHTGSGLYKLMVNFGPISDVQLRSPFSAVVVFERLEDSCQVVRAKTIGPRGIQVHCQWHHACMKSRQFYSTGNVLKAINNELVCPSI